MLGDFFDDLDVEIVDVDVDLKFEMSEVLNDVMPTVS